MGIVIGPFDEDDWYTLGQLKSDLAFLRKKRDCKGNDIVADFKVAEREVRKTWRKYALREYAA